MKITKIELQKNNPDRVNIYVDDKFFCGLDVEILYSLCLKEGNELTEEQKQHMFDNDYDGSCGCKSLESTGRCWMADAEEIENW